MADTIYTTAAAGAVSVGSNWVGGVKPPAGSRVRLAHAMTIDEDVTWGDSPPARVLTLPTVNVTGGGSSGGALAAGTYRVTYAPVDSGGKVGAPSPASATFTVTAGNIPRVTLPSRPTGVSSWNIFLSNTSAPTGARKLYATGVTGTTTDLALGTWLDASLAAVAYSSADAEVQGYALLIDNSCPLTVRARVTVRGNALQGNSTITLDRGYTGVGIRFDSTGASSPSNAAYAWFMGRSFTQTSCMIATTGTTNRVTIDSLTTGGALPGYFVEGTADAGSGQLSDTTFWQVPGVDFVDVGDTVRDAISMRPSTGVVNYTFEDCTFTRCGTVIWNSNVPATASLSYRRNQHTSTNARTNAGTGNVNCVRFSISTTKNAGQTRVVEHCSFDQKPYLRGGAIIYTDNFFWLGWDHASDATAWEGFTGFVRKTVNNSQATNGEVSDMYFLTDPVSTVASGASSGTVSSGSNGATSGTLSDSSKSWTTNQWYNIPTTQCFVRKVAAADGSIEERRITGNTGTDLTTEPPWDTEPVAGDTYEIYTDMYNPHGCTAPAIAGNTYEHDRNIWHHYGCDADGDWLYTFGTASTHYCRNNIVLPNRSGADMSGCLHTMFSNTNASARLYTNHNTCPVGTQSLVQVDEGGTTQPAGTLAECKSNLIYGLRPASQYTGGLNGYLICNSDNPSSGPATDIIDPANISHNWHYQGNTGGLATNGVNIILSTNAPAPVGTSDPQLVDTTRNVLTWGERVRGTDGSLTAALTELSDDPSLIPSMLTWVRGGFAPRNAGLKDAGHDGVTIGAVEGVFSSGGRLVGPGLVGPSQLIRLGGLHVSR